MLITMSTQMELNRNLAQMLKGGVIMDVTTPVQAKIAEEAGACAVTTVTDNEAKKLSSDEALDMLKSESQIKADIESLFAVASSGRIATFELVLAATALTCT